MEKLFQLFQGIKITYPSYEGIVCGYNDANFILAVETTNTRDFFKVLKKEFFVLEEYKDPKYRYILEDEQAIDKQIKSTKIKDGSTEKTTKQGYVK